MRRSSCRASRPWMPTPLLPASVNVRTMSRPCSSAYRWMAACWFSVEYCWCSVDMRTYSAARMGPDVQDEMDACDVLTSLLLRRAPPSDDWQPARLGVLDAIIHSRTKGANLRNLQLRQNGHNLLASPESRLCISNAIA